MITQRSSSGTKTTRASSKPHCSLSIPSAGASSGSGSIVQPSIPLLERATERCERPVRSSTRASRTVVPFDLRRGGVEHGVDRIRPVLRGQDRVGRVAIEELSALATSVHAGSQPVSRVRWTAGSPAASSSSAARWTASVDSAPWLSFVVSSPSPSLQPPVAKSYSGRWRRLRPRNQSNDRCARFACSGSPVTANAASSAATKAEASSGCSSPPPGAGSVRRAAEMTGQPERPFERGRTRRRASEAPRGPSAVRSSRPSATPPTISACGSRALS